MWCDRQSRRRLKTFVNYSTVTASAGTGPLVIAVPFTNWGELKVPGELDLLSTSKNYSTINLGDERNRRGIIRYDSNSLDLQQLNKSDVDHYWYDGTQFVGHGQVIIAAFPVPQGGDTKRVDALVNIPVGVKIVIPEGINLITEGGRFAVQKKTAEGP
jgi:hypothetical protein